MNINLLEQENLANLVSAGEIDDHTETVSHRKNKINLKPFVRWIVYVITLLLPIFVLPWTSEVVEFNKQTLLIILVSAGLVLFLVDLIQSGTARIRKSKLYFPLAVFLLVSVFTAIFSKNIYSSFIGTAGGSLSYSFATLFALVILFFLAINIELSIDKLKKLLITSLGIVFLWSILQVFGVIIFKQPPFSFSNFNTLGSMNMLAVIAALLLPMFFEEKL